MKTATGDIIVLAGIDFWEVILKTVQSHEQDVNDKSGKQQAEDLNGVSKKAVPRPFA
ncbi:MAG TPA: hypothetical protein VEZ13_08020 [Brevibacillus sp.]|nr:hypothetical protein [Brevibacillus sp.]